MTWVGSAIFPLFFGGCLFSFHVLTNIEDNSHERTTLFGLFLSGYFTFGPVSIEVVNTCNIVLVSCAYEACLRREYFATLEGGYHDHASLIISPHISPSATISGSSIRFVIEHGVPLHG